MFCKYMLSVQVRFAPKDFIALSFIKKKLRIYIYNYTYNMLLNIELYKLLILSTTLFFVSILGVLLLRRNLLAIIMSLELVLLSVNFNFILFSIYLDDIVGQIFTLLILTVAAAESSIGLAILVMYYRRKGIISINIMNYIKG